jgi:S-adenosylmethionine:tRNA ribosyltransferase-isomerase
MTNSTSDPRLLPYDYHLPEDRIAVHPLEERSSSKMLVLDQSSHSDSYTKHLPEWLNSGDVLLLNNTKVLQARVPAKRVSGGKVEVLFLHSDPDEQGRVSALVKPSRKLREGEVLYVGDIGTVTLVSYRGEGEWFVESSVPPSEIMQRSGSVPIPPYLRRENVPTDQQRYQTVFAEHEGAVAAPTAGLHFTPEVLDALQQKGVQVHFVTLHVGIGTFRNLRSEDLDAQKLHQEWFEITEEVAQAITHCKQQGNKVIAVGTTVTRCVESAWLQFQNSDNPLKTRDNFHGSGYTDIFIQPGFQFQVVDGLLTNFHLPKSSLLMLVSAFAGRERVLECYHYAIQEQYRFFSYGDAMLILP